MQSGEHVQLSFFDTYKIKRMKFQPLASVVKVVRCMYAKKRASVLVSMLLQNQPP